jgi:WD40 repeat protein
MKKIVLIPFDFSKSNINNMTKKYKILLEAEEKINQLKLMKNKNDHSIYITAVDDKGYLHVKKIEYNFYENKLEELNYLRFNCSVNSSDNSIWSLDCYYPYVIVGGNHKCAMIFNIDKDLNTTLSGLNPIPIKNNFVYKGNKHNVPYVSFSPNGEFVSCASIDTEMKIWDVYSGRLMKKIDNKNKKW